MTIFHCLNSILAIMVFILLLIVLLAIFGLAFIKSVEEGTWGYYPDEMFKQRIKHMKVTSFLKFKTKTTIIN